MNSPIVLVMRDKRDISPFSSLALRVTGELTYSGFQMCRPHRFFIYFFPAAIRELTDQFFAFCTLPTYEVAVPVALGPGQHGSGGLLPATGDQSTRVPAPSRLC
jgi:hypothetical protein